MVTVVAEHVVRPESVDVIPNECLNLIQTAVRGVSGRFLFPAHVTGSRRKEGFVTDVIPPSSGAELKVLPPEVQQSVVEADSGS